MSSPGGRGRNAYAYAEYERPREYAPASRGRLYISEASRRGRHIGRHRAGGTRRPPTRSDDRRTENRAMPFWQELPLLVLIAFSLALLIKTFLLQAFFIPSGSMERTLLVKDRVLVNKVVYDFRAPQRGEVIVFRGVDSWKPETVSPPPTGVIGKAKAQIGGLVGLAAPDEKDFIKRVIGTPGDQVRCCDPQGRVTVNGKPLDEPYVFDNNPLDSRAFGPVTVPPGRLFVMGDHRGGSQDSRAYIGASDGFKGTVPIDSVIGRAFVKVWPVARWDGLPVPDTWQFVPPAQASGPVGVRVGPGLTGTAPLIAPALLVPITGRRRRGARQGWLARRRARARGRPW